MHNNTISFRPYYKVGKYSHGIDDFLHPDVCGTMFSMCRRTLPEGRKHDANEWFPDRFKIMDGRPFIAYSWKYAYTPEEEKQLQELFRKK